MGGLWMELFFHLFLGRDDKWEVSYGFGMEGCRLGQGCEGQIGYARGAAGEGGGEEQDSTVGACQSSFFMLFHIDSHD